jgi:hypothetical protein
MSQHHEQDLIQRIVEQIRRDMPTAPSGMREDEFDHLCRNIARAISGALAAHQEQYHRVEPDFGEVQRPE